MKTTHRTLKILAAIIWYTGGVALVSKAGSLLFEAQRIRPEGCWSWLAILVGLLGGAVKARFLFFSKCKKNLARIDRLTQPKVWQFYRPGFFFFLALMIALGTLLSKMAQGSYVFLLFVAALDLSIATALLGSGFVFFKAKAMD